MQVINDTQLTPHIITIATTSSKTKQLQNKHHNNPTSSNNTCNTIKTTFTSTMQKSLTHKRTSSQSANKVAQPKVSANKNHNSITAPVSSLNSPKNNLTPTSSYQHYTNSKHNQNMNSNTRSSLELSANDKLSNYNMFLQTINIISEIQEQFESSVKENKKPLDEIKRLIDNDLNIDNYIALSENQKENITTDISLSSDLRIQNYKTAFNYIFTSLDDIEHGLERLLPQEHSEQIDEVDVDDIIQNDNYCSSGDELEEDINEEVVTNKEINNESKGKFHTYRGETVKQTKLDDADFSEGDMLENAFILPPKNSPFNYQYVKDMARMRSKKFSVLNHDKKKNKKSDKGVVGSKKEGDDNNSSSNNNNIPDKENVMKQIKEIKNTTQSSIVTEEDNSEESNVKKKEADMECNMF